ncbi:putative membrane protein [Bradyrhizobium sp. R2.2-H]|nr:putative membrane protein [Bradyrhizobium sp. Y-H1]TCU70768.1 putative membrane protein [Bradyrhizobium sp. R2.2-H]
MTHMHPPATAAIGGQPIHSMLAQFPTVCFTLTLFTDIVYWRTSYLMWQEFSSWLLLAGLVSGALALVAGVIAFLFSSAVRAAKPAWPHAIGGVIVLALAFLNSLAHARDGWIAVVPWGLILSVATIIAMVISNWLGRALVFHYGVGVRRHD